MAKDSITVRILGDASGFEKSTNIAIGASDSLGKKMAGVFGGLQVDRAAQAVVGFGKDSVEAFKESEKSTAALQFAFDKFPALSDSSADAFGRLDAALAKKTKFDDDATKSGQAALAQFGLTGKQVEALTPLLQDYAAKTGKDLPSAAEDLGKAMLGQGRALKQVGIEFADTGTASGNFAQLMGGLSGAVGGFAEKEGTTAAGKAEILKNQFGELQETVGSKLLPVMSKLTEILLDVVNVLTSTNGPTQIAVASVAALAAGLGVLMVVQKAATAMQVLFAEGTIANAAAQKIAAVATKAWTLVQEGFNLVMEMNPIGLVVIALVALAAGLYYAYKHSETFRDIVDGVFHAVADTGIWLWENVLKPVGGFIGNVFLQMGRDLSWVWGNVLKPIFGAIGDAASGLKSIFATAFGALEVIMKAPLNGIIWLVNKMVDGLNSIHVSVPDWVPIVGGKSFGLSLPHIPQLAAGGIVKASPGGTLALLGEAGRDEAVVPLGSGGAGGVGQTIVVNNYISGSVVAERDLTGQTVRGLEEYFSRGGVITDRRGGTLRPA